MKPKKFQIPHMVITREDVAEHTSTKLTDSEMKRVAKIMHDFHMNDYTYYLQQAVKETLDERDE